VCVKTLNLNPVGDEALQGLKQLWTRHGVRWGTFQIHKGDGYLIAAGIPHEFLNLSPALSIAWNIVPACDEEQGSEPIPWILLQRSLRDAEVDLAGTSGRLVASIDHAPATVLLRQTFPKAMPMVSPVPRAGRAKRSGAPNPLDTEVLQRKTPRQLSASPEGVLHIDNPGSFQKLKISEQRVAQVPDRERVHDAIKTWAQQRLQPADVTPPPMSLRVPAQNALQDLKEYLETNKKLEILQQVNAMSPVDIGRHLCSCLREAFNDADITTLWSHQVRILKRVQWRGSSGGGGGGDGGRRGGGGGCCVEDTISHPPKLFGGGGGGGDSER